MLPLRIRKLLVGERWLHSMMTFQCSVRIHLECGTVLCLGSFIEPDERTEKVRKGCHTFFCRTSVIHDRAADKKSQMPVALEL